MYEECLTRRGHIPLSADWGNDYKPVLDVYLEVSGLPIENWLKFNICADCSVLFLAKNEKEKVTQDVHGEAYTL